MNSLIRAALIVALGLGVNVLCGDAWADEGSPEPAEAVDEDGGAGAHKAWVESIWATP